MKKIITLLLLCFLRIISTEAQTTGQINGHIIDEKQIPVKYAVVSLFRAADTVQVKSAITTEKGEFKFVNLSEGIYFIAVEWVGYVKKLNGPFTLNPEQQLLSIPQIVILPETKQLNTVSIVGQKPLIERKSNLLIMNVANSTLAAGSTALEILSKAPGVSIDNDGNISLRGKPGVNVMIDGKLTFLSAAQLASLLRTTDANSIQTIEFMTNPSAKYDAAGTGGLINIKLKKNTNYGTNGTLTAGGGYGSYYKSNAGVTLNHRSKKYKLIW